ncbi:MAG TPA: MFS transporter [Ktedonobacterales bacterium]|nr:MFS transporter [Ktedonobacterales bacterium]
MSTPLARPTATATLSPRRTTLILVVVGVALMSVVSAVSGLNVALPSLARDTGASQTQLTWIVDAYTVVFSGLLLFAGSLGDRFGRRALLLVGLVIFGVAAGFGLFTKDPGTLILARVAMGIGAAGIMPTTLSVITTSFSVEQRPRAIGIWVGIAGGGAVIGLFGAGLLLQFYSWQSFFALNVALAALAFIGVLAFVPSLVDDQRPGLDIVGAFFSLITVASMVFAIIEGPDRGWANPVTLGAFLLGALAGVCFVLWELRRKEPMLDPRLFRLRGFSAGTLTVAVQFLSAFGFFFIFIQYLQYVTGRSPLAAAVALFPLPIVLLPTARQAPLLAQRIGFRRVGPLGLTSMAVGFLILSRITIHTPYWVLAVSLVFFALGMGLAGTPATTAITESLPVSKQGVASAVNDASREVGSALGIAILGSILNQQYRSGVAGAYAGLPHAVAAGVRSSIAFTSSPLVHEFGPAGQRLVTQAEIAFVHGVDSAVLVGAGLLLVAAVVIGALAPRETKNGPR